MCHPYNPPPEDNDSESTVSFDSLPGLISDNKLEMDVMDAAPEAMNPILGRPMHGIFIDSATFMMSLYVALYREAMQVPITIMFYVDTVLVVAQPTASLSVADLASRDAEGDVASLIHWLLMLSYSMENGSASTSISDDDFDDIEVCFLWSSPY